jgi:uncharacterized membrane protein
MDYIYNYIAHHIKKPPVPERSAQGRFACKLATFTLATIIVLMVSDYLIPSYILGGFLLISAALVSTVDYCIPSKIYNRFSH